MPTSEEFNRRMDVNVLYTGRASEALEDEERIMKTI